MAFFRYLVPFMIVTLVVSPGLSQSALSGKLTDHQTGEPVPFANVYFASTTLGTSSLSDGTFTINKIPSGKYDLLVEVIGYRRHRQPIEFEGGAYHLDISLDQDTVQLNPITVVAESDKKYFALFRSQFIGGDLKAMRCSIPNPEVLHFYFDAGQNYLSVTARQPIQILNPELGYKVYFTLDHFEIDFKNSSKSIEGISRFEELPARSRLDSTKREKSRTLAYRGSLFHFMRSFFHGTIEKEGFKLFAVDTVRKLGDDQETEVLRRLVVKDAVADDQVRILNYQGLLKLEYRQQQAWGYPGRGKWERNPKGYQQTYLLLKDPSLRIYENGYYAEQNSIFMTGYLMWRETIANLVPLGYEPAEKKSKR